MNTICLYSVCVILGCYSNLNTFWYQPKCVFSIEERKPPSTDSWYWMFGKIDILVYLLFLISFKISLILDSILLLLLFLKVRDFLKSVVLVLDPKLGYHICTCIIRFHTIPRLCVKDLIDCAGKIRKQPHNCHYILIKIFLNRDYTVCHITFLQFSPTSRGKNTNTEISCEKNTKIQNCSNSVRILCCCWTLLLIVKGWLEKRFSGPWTDWLTAGQYCTFFFVVSSCADS